MDEKETGASEKKTRKAPNKDETIEKDAKKMEQGQSELAVVENKIDKLTEVITLLVQTISVAYSQKPSETEDDFIEKALASDEIRAKIIAEYLKNLTNNDTVRVLSGEVGATPLTPAPKPKNLADAKKLAELLIKR